MFEVIGYANTQTHHDQIPAGNKRTQFEPQSSEAKMTERLEGGARGCGEPLLTCTSLTSAFVCQGMYIKSTYDGLHVITGTTENVSFAFVFFPSLSWSGSPSTALISRGSRIARLPALQVWQRKTLFSQSSDSSGFQSAFP